MRPVRAGVRERAVVVVAGVTRCRPHRLANRPRFCQRVCRWAARTDTGLTFVATRRCIRQCLRRRVFTTLMVVEPVRAGARADLVVLVFRLEAPCNLNALACLL